MIDTLLGLVIYVLVTFVIGLFSAFAEIPPFSGKRNLRDCTILDIIFLPTSGGFLLVMGVIWVIIKICEFNFWKYLSFIPKFFNYQPFRKLSPEEKAQKSRLYKAMNE
jgi:hypothetical protein